MIHQKMNKDEPSLELINIFIERKRAGWPGGSDLGVGSSGGRGLGGLGVGVGLGPPFAAHEK